MPRLPKEELQKIYDERRTQITAAAVRIFAQYGLRDTKISMITAEAGVSHGLFYHYFKSKEELFISLVRAATEASISEIDNLGRLPGSPLEKIRVLTEGMLDENAVPVFMFLHHVRNARELPEELGQLLKEYPMEVYVERLLPLFKEGQERGEIVDGDLEELISDYLSILSGVMVLGNGYSIPRAELLLRFVQKR